MAAIQRSGHDHPNQPGFWFWCWQFPAGIWWSVDGLAGLGRWLASGVRGVLILANVAGVLSEVTEGEAATVGWVCLFTLWVWHRMCDSVWGCGLLMKCQNTLLSCGPVGFWVLFFSVSLWGIDVSSMSWFAYCLSQALPLQTLLAMVKHELYYYCKI